MLRRWIAILLVGVVTSATVNVGADGQVQESEYTLRYFNARGRGEVIRTLFAASGTQFTDVRYNGRPEFEADRDTGIFPYHQVPVLEVDGVQIAQSHAIERLLAGRFDLLGDNDVETALIDGVGEHVIDIMNAFYKVKYGGASDEEKSALFDDFYGGHFVKQVNKLEAIAAANEGSPYIVGDELSVADIEINVMLEAFGDNAAQGLGDCPNIAKLSDVVASSPGIREWKQSRPADGPRQPVYKLRYFNARGRAEVIRHLFAVSGTEYEDIRYTDPDRNDFNADREAGHMPYAQVPVLEVDGVPIAQSRSIERFLARRYGLLGGEDDVTVTQIEGIGEHVVDMSSKHSSIKYNRDISDEDKEKTWDEYYAEFVPRQLGKLEVFAAANEGSDYIVGDSLTLADIQINVYLDSLRNLDALSDLPNLTRLHEVVANTDGIKEWKEARPEQ